jgi:hypothetical protein
MPLLWLSTTFLAGIWLEFISGVPGPLNLLFVTPLSFPAFLEKRFAV